MPQEGAPLGSLGVYGMRLNFFLVVVEEIGL